MADHEYASGFNLTHLMVPTKAATIFAAQESSLYMGGALVPMLNCPAGSTQVKVPSLAKLTDPTVISAEANSETGVGDITVTTMGSDSVPINLGLYASRSVVRDLGGIDTNEIGRVLGNSIASVWDKAVTASFAGLTAQEIVEDPAVAPGAAKMTVEDLFKAVGTIRGNGETGPLFGIIGTNQYANLMKDIGGSAFAGGEFQNTAMRNGYFGTIAGVPLFVSSYVNNTDMNITTNPAAAIMSADAVKGATQGGVNLEMSRRPEAVGFDVVASLAAGVALIDASRGVLIIDNT
jgi:hypothetical protein